MKRIWLALGIFSVILTLCILSLTYQQRQVNVLLDELETVVTVYNTGDTQRAHALALELEQEYTRRTRLFPLFMAHGDLMECREGLALLPSILKDGDTEEFHMESTRCRIQLEKLAKSELPILQNIL